MISLNTPYHKSKKNAIIIASLLFLLALCSLIALLPHPNSHAYTAQIYQSGQLLQSIPLYSVQENYTFTLQGPKGEYNEIEVRPGSIGILSASCPDKLCVGQGFIKDSMLPITCLPNQVVILLRPADDTEAAPDVITY